MRAFRQFVPPLLWMAVIFTFSTSLFGGESTGGILGPLVRFFCPSVSPELFDALHFTIRKLAHLTEYAVLALLWRRAFARQGCDARKALLLSFAISALYAASDEFHQSFVPNRTPSVMDVIVDVSGAAAGLLAFRARAKIKGATT